MLILLFSPKVVYLTENYAKEIEAKFGCFYKKKHIKIISNGINLNYFKKLDNINKADWDFTFSMISRMTPLRDHKTLIDAFSETAVNKKFRLIIAGDGSTKKNFEKYVEEQNLSDKVTFTGNLDEHNVIKLLSSTDIYIHSSLAETFSTSLLQVMACKIPIIATNISGVNDLLVDGKDSLLFEVKNKIELKAKIEKLILDRELAANLSENAYRKVVNKYSCELMFNKYQTIFKKL